MKIRWMPRTCDSAMNGTSRVAGFAEPFVWRDFPEDGLCMHY